jgi:hypothetical protein
MRFAFSFQAPYQPLERLLIRIVIFPATEITDVPCPAKIGGPSFRHVDNGPD